MIAKKRRKPKTLVVFFWNKKKNASCYTKHHALLVESFIFIFPFVNSSFTYIFKSINKLQALELVCAHAPATTMFWWQAHRPRSGGGHLLYALDITLVPTEDVSFTEIEKLKLSSVYLLHVKVNMNEGGGLSS